MVRIAIGIVRIRHPVLAKSDHLSCSRNTLEFVPILSGFLFHCRPNPEIKVAPLGTPVLAARHRNGDNQYARYPDEVRRRTIRLKRHLIYDCIDSDGAVLCEYGGGDQRKKQAR